MRFIVVSSSRKHKKRKNKKSSRSEKDARSVRQRRRAKRVLCFQLMPVIREVDETMEMDDGSSCSSVSMETEGSVRWLSGFKLASLLFGLSESSILFLETSKQVLLFTFWRGWGTIRYLSSLLLGSGICVLVDPTGSCFQRVLLQRIPGYSSYAQISLHQDHWLQC